MEILEVLEEAVEVEILFVTVSEVGVEKLGNTAGDVETEEEVKMHGDKVASGGREN